MEDSTPVEDRTKPLKISSSSAPDSFTRTFSPGNACVTLFSSQSMPRAFTGVCRKPTKIVFFIRKITMKSLCKGTDLVRHN